MSGGAVLTKAFARRQAVVLVLSDDLDQAVEALETRRNVVPEIDQYRRLLARRFAHPIGEHHRRFCFQRMAGPTVRDEGQGLEGPEHAVERIANRRLGRHDQEPLTRRVRFLGDAGGDDQLVLCVVIEVDAWSHGDVYCAAARAIR